MPLLLERQAVLETLAEARARRWVVPAFGVENLTTMEATLAAARDRAEEIGVPDLPIMLAVTNNYPPRPQTIKYTHTRKWEVGLELFLAEASVLAGPSSPYGDLRVMLHLDHALYDLDEALFRWDLRRFSSVMYDASALPLQENIARTREFVRQHRGTILIEGACDEIGHKEAPVTTPAVVERYFRETGVDLVVANLGTEHRAGASDLRYESELAHAMSTLIGPHLVLHGTSSVASASLGTLSRDGICKANVWTVLERDSTGLLLEAMIQNAARITPAAATLVAAGLLGPSVDLSPRPDVETFPTAWRQQVVFEEMKRIASRYLAAWFPEV